MSGQRRGMSEREYARHAGVSRGAAQKARNSGRLVLHPDGSVDASASDARRAQATAEGRRSWDRIGGFVRIQRKDAEQAIAIFLTRPHSALEGIGWTG